MPLLNSTDTFYVGDTAVDSVYIGTEKIWPSTFNPKQVPGLLTWLDAQAITGKNNGDPVLTWKDTSGHGFDAVQVGGTAIYHPDAINHHPALRFGEFGFTEMRSNQTHAVNDRTVFQVLQIDPGVAPFGPYHTTQLQTNAPFMQTFSNGGIINTYTNPAPLSSNKSWSGKCQFVTLWSSTATATNWLEVDGTQVSAAWTPATSTDPFHVGGFQPGGYAMNGLFGELLIYERCLTDDERGKVQTYLTDKWKSAWSPPSLPGLTLWVDASQLGLASGVAVSPWPNLGSGTVGTTEGTPAPIVRTNALNQLPVVRYKVNEGRHRWAGLSATTEWTILWAGRMVGPTYGRIVSGIYSPNNILVGYWNGFEDVCYDAGFTNPNTQTPATTNWRMYSADGTTSPSQTTRFFGNGVLLGSTPTGLGWGGTMALSGYAPNTDASETCDCEVAEVLMYDRKLSDADRQTVEAYLRAKWGLS